MGREEAEREGGREGGRKERGRKERGRERGRERGGKEGGRKGGVLLSKQIFELEHITKWNIVFFQIKRMIQSRARNSILGIHGWIQLSASHH